MKTSTQTAEQPVKRADQDAFKGVDNNYAPQAVQVEEQIIGGLLSFGANSSPVVDDVLLKLKAEHFYVTRHAKVYRAIQRLRSEEKPIDLMTVTIEMGRSHPSQIEEIQNFLADVFSMTISPGMIDAYADIVIEKAYRRDVIRQAIALVDLATDEANESETIRDHIESKLLHLLTQQKSAGRLLSDSMPEAFVEFQQAVEMGVMPGIPTGYEGLNEILNGGFRRGSLNVIAGRPSMGKSAFAVGCLLPYIASITNQISIVFSLEMSEEELIHRFWSSRMKRPWAVSRMEMEDKDWMQLGKVVSELSDLPIYVDDTPKISFEHIRAESRRLKAQHGEIGCIVVDYLQIMEYRGNNPVQAIGNITSGLKALAKELDTVVIVLSQLSRGVESREDKRPIMSDLRDSGSIEQDANSVMFLYRDEYYKKHESEEPGIAEVIVAKNRGGKPGTVKLSFDGARTSFYALYKPVPDFSYPVEDTAELPKEIEEEEVISFEWSEGQEEKPALASVDW